MKQKINFEESIRKLDGDDHDISYGIISQLATLMCLPQSTILEISSFSDWFSGYQNKLQGNRHIDLVKLIKENSTRSGTNWGNVFEKTFLFSVDKNFCEEAISFFVECIDKDRGIRIEDVTGTIYFRKAAGHKTVLRINPPGYGYRDDFTQFSLYQEKQKTTDQGATKYYSLSNKVNFKQITSNEGVEDNRFEQYPEIINDLCKYANLVYEQDHFNKDNKEQISQLRMVLKQHIVQISKN